MISAQRRSVDAASGKTKRTGVTQPLLKSEVFSKHVTPVPPSASAIRYEPLSRRSRKTGMLFVPKTAESSQSISEKNENIPKFKALGLEVRPEQVVWKGWEPGEEYTKNLTLKNVHVKTQKIKYKVPSSRFFSTLFPQAIVLSAGTSFTLPVTFRPLEKEKYEDRIEFSTGSGTFSISLQALLPETKLHLPESIHFGLTAIHDTMELNFEMKNMSSELPTNYSWQVSEPFAIIPTSGLLQPTASCTLKVIFRPTTANVFEATAVCSFGQNMVKTMKLEGIGKYPHILVSTSTKLPKDLENENSMPVLKFNNVNVHHSAEKFITLHNLSNVKTPFKVQRLFQTLRLDLPFHSPITSGMIPAMGNFKLPITYTPHAAGKTNVDYFKVSAFGSISKSTLKCIGSCTGPNIQLSVSAVNFGVVSQGKSATRSFQITNESDCEAVYQILLDECNCVFSVNSNSGFLASNSSQTHIVHFTPPHSINYHKRVTILIHEQEPIFVDFLGTCHTEECKPPMLKEENLHRYRVHVERGLSHYPPDILNSQLKEGKLVQDEDGYLMLAGDKQELLFDKQSPMDEYFDDGHNTEITHYPPHVSLDQASVWIGQVEYHTSCHVTIQMTNHTRGKVTAMWIDDPTCVFEVHPSSCDIPPLKSTDFRIIFKPNAPNQFFGKELECYVFYKCMRDYRLVEDVSICLPWLLTVDVSAHTFVGSNETFLPESSFSTQNMILPAVSAGENSYKTILLENKGNTPLLYQFVKAQNDGFIVKQQQGLVRSRYHISTVRLNPKKVSTYNSFVTLRLNDNTKNDKIIKLVGSGEQPELLLSNEGEMYFRPTCVSTTNKREFEVQNIGRIPLMFNWHFPGRDSKFLSVTPQEGVIYPNEIQNHTWTFTPAEGKKYVFKPICLTWHYQADSQYACLYNKADARLFAIRTVGEGFEGDIKAERCNVDFGCVITGSNSTQPLILFNNSECDLHFRLCVEQHINSQYGENPDANEPIGLKLNKWEAVLPARSKIPISVTAHPYRRVLYTWSLFYELLNTSGEPINKNCRILLSELSAEGVYPTLSVIDARPSGSGSSISKTQLWRWFSLEHLNTCLDSDPTTAELVYSVNTRHSTSRRPSLYTKSIMEFNFGAASIDSEPCYVSMMVQNTGLVETKWAFLFPKDMELDMDYWAETGAFDPEELHELHIQDNMLFTVKPSRGVLKPGESRTILLSYKHDVAGTHRLPVLFKIENGKEVLLNFIGVTVQLNRRYLHFPGTKHTFTPVPIGGPTPPKQLYDMFNGGCMSVIYEVDMEPLRELQESNYNHPVLTCLNPRGEIPPGTSANMEWIFSPLESKTYTVDIPIHIIGGETALITFNGIGYDGRAMGGTMPMLDQPAEYTAVPSTQKVPVPDQIMFLSEERVSFGNVPLFSRSRHVIFLSNKSHDRPLSYSWHAASEIVNDVLRVEPVKGYLAPGERTMTRITFCAAGQPSFFDLDLICEVVDEIKMAEYHAELEAWQAERDRQAVEFHITDDDVPDDVTKPESFEVHSGPSKYSMTSPRRNLENVLNKRPSPLRLTDSVVSKQSLKSERKNFQTLPPIRFENPVKLPSNRSRLLRHEEANVTNEWIQPQSPRPFVNHLGVTARTHDIAEFRTNFSKQSKAHFVDRNLQVAYPVGARSPESQYPLTTCNEGEKDVVISVLSNVLRGLLDDPTFHGDVRDIATQPTPYFGQLAREEELDVDLEVEVDKENDKLDEDKKDEKQEEDSKVDETKEDDKEQEEAVIREEPGNQQPPPPPEQATTNLMDEILRQEGESRPSSSGTQQSARDRATVGRSAMSSTRKREIEQDILQMPEFGSLLEDVFSSTITNIMEEALKGDVILTARPRAVALPPSRGGDSSEKRPSSKPGSSRRSAPTNGTPRKRNSKSSRSSVSQN